MIAIKRGPEPEFLRSDKIIRAKDMLYKSFEKSERQERFHFDNSLIREIRPQLLEMCNYKCAYCESKISVTDFGDIENFRPKAGARGLSNEYAPNHYWWLAYEWENLLVSCKICNQKYKRDFFPLEDESMRCEIGAMGPALLAENALLLNPCIDDPKQHLVFHNDGKISALSTKGETTIEIIGLNREDLVNKRNQVGTQLQRDLDSLGRHSVQFEQDVYNYINEFLSDETQQEYKATLRSIFQEWHLQNVDVWQSIEKKYGKKPMNRFTDAAQMPKSFSRSERRIESENKIKKVKEKLSTIKRFTIKSIEIRNFKSIDELNLNILQLNASENRESWLLFLGDNGIGKSSILQAIALTLAGRKQFDILKLDVTDYLKRGKDDGYVRIQSFEHDKPVELRFNKKEFTSDLDEAHGFILGYGSTRLLPKGSIQPDLNQVPYVNITNLFDYSVSLNDPVKWLRDLNLEEFKSRVAPSFFDVLALRGEDKLWIDEGKVMIKQFGENNELEDNSDGYKTVVALVTDIMQTLAIDSASYHNTNGIVLIDEIGNHLHPRWRMKIVGALRKAFPKLQFIVTTHEPLCLRGVNHGEVVVLVRDQQNKIRSLDRTLLPDHNAMRIEQLLTSDLFGLINVLDEETEKSYEEYYNLLSKKEEDKTEEDKNRIQEISSHLISKDVLGTTPQEQVMYQVINETYAKKIREEGFKTKEELKKETVQEVKEIIKEKKLDWL